MNDLEKISGAKKALAEAKELTDILQIKDMATAAREYAKAAKLGLDAQNAAAEITIRAKRKAGDVLANIPKQEGARTPKTELHNVTPLSELGIQKHESSRWQKIANIPEPKFESIVAETKDAGKELTESMMLKVEKEIKRDERINNEINARKDVISSLDIRDGDFKTVLDDVYNIDAIITDPPYPKEYIKCFSDLSFYASKHLKEDGFCVVYSGQYNIPEVINRLSEHLTYVWTFCLYHEGKTQLVNGVNIMCGWKPVFIFSKGRKKMNFSAYDIIISEAREKHSHDWQQSESGVNKLIEIFSKPSDLIVDPFSGSGTFVKCAEYLGRKGIGAEIK